MRIRCLCDFPFHFIDVAMLPDPNIYFGVYSWIITERNNGLYDKYKAVVMNLSFLEPYRHVHMFRICE